MNIINGKLYQITKWCWFVYPTLYTATLSETVGAVEHDEAWVNSYTNSFNQNNKCKISKLLPNDCFVVINTIDSHVLFEQIRNQIMANVLTPEGETGWIILPQLFLTVCIKQINNE